MRSRGKWARAALLHTPLIAIVAMASLWLALLVTPFQTVEVVPREEAVAAVPAKLGPDDKEIEPAKPAIEAKDCVCLKVGAGKPSLSWWGPAESHLFGQTVGVVPHFPGPIRPRVELESLTVERQVADAVAHHETLSHKLKVGWLQYFAWVLLITIGSAGLVLLVIYDRLRHFKRLRRFKCMRRLTWKPVLKLTGLGMAVALVLCMGSGVATAWRGANVVKDVKSVHDLIGSSPITLAPGPVGPKLGDVKGW
jgi:hypothetical protein